MAFRFEIVARDPHSRARAGLLHTPHGVIPTPAFVPVATQGTVKAAAPRDLQDLGASLLICNAYHLALRPGADVVAGLGGLHSLAGWPGPLMADSGGFQVFSLESRRQVDGDGVTFRSHVDGSTWRFTPESVVALQESLGADLVMPLDVCTGYPASPEVAHRDAELTLAWASRAANAHRRDGQLLYGIVQGGTDADLRRESARATAALGFGAFAVGGVSVGEPRSEMAVAVAAVTDELPEAAPRHLLGVGEPDDVPMAVSLGIDTFDCVVPTRWARNAAALTPEGRVNLRNAAFAADGRPLVEGCECYACRTFSRAAIRHFIKAGEILGLHLLTVHNLHTMLRLVADARARIVDGTFARWRAEAAAVAARSGAEVTP